MDFFIAIILGIVQGITEFLPVSSSGHLVLLEKLFNISENLIFLNVVLHISTLFAVILFYRKKVWFLITHPLHKDTINLGLATLPTILIVLIFKDFFENSFSGAWLIWGFLLTAIFLTITEQISKIYERSDYKYQGINKTKSLFLGLFQGLAVLPGLSRSGTTLCAGIVMGINKKSAVDFSFLMSIPIIFASLVYELIDNDLSSISNSYGFFEVFASCMFAFVFAIIGIKIMLKVVEKIKYFWFSIYLVVLSILILIFV
ncbi:MAG: undecaprenyl-diphosphate phosphatase [Bacilli bacterium]